MRAERFKLVSVLDPALDLTVPELVAYQRERDFATLRFLPGEKPTVFYVREVPHGLWESFVAAGDSEVERFRRAFAAGVEKVENLMQADGVALATWEPKSRLERLKVTVLSDEECHLFSPQEREEIGAVVYQHSFLPRKIAAVYRRLASLDEPLAQRRFRLAEPSQEAAEGPSNAKPSASTSPSPAATGSA